MRSAREQTVPDLKSAAGPVLGPNHGAGFHQGRTMLEPHQRAAPIFIRTAGVAEMK